MKTLGQKIAYLRKEKNISQETLGLELGVSRSAIVKWEKDIAHPNHDSLNLLCQYFGVEANYFFYDNIESKNSDLQKENNSDNEIAITIASKSKNRIYIISLIVFSVLFILSALATIAFSFIAFTDNTGYQTEKTSIITDVLFYIVLTLSIILLFLIIFFIVKLKSRQK